jgi:hypothetical protein
MNVAFMVDKLQKKTCFYCAEPIRMQTLTGGSTAYVHTEAQNGCKTSKCAARSVDCVKCKRAGLSHSHHVRAVCPFKFEFCKKIAADKKFKDELVRVNARRQKEQEEKLERQQEKEKKQRAQLDAANVERARKDQQFLMDAKAKVEELEKAAAVSRPRAPVASGPPGSVSSGFSARLPQTSPSVQEKWEYVEPTGLAKASLFKWGIPASTEDWVEWQSSRWGQQA